MASRMKQVHAAARASKRPAEERESIILDTGPFASVINQLVGPDLLIPDTARCQEASVFSTDSYIPCGAPASAIVKHNGRTERPYFMCQACASHNVANRNASLLAERPVVVNDSVLLAREMPALATLPTDMDTIAKFRADLMLFLREGQSLEAEAVAMRTVARDRVLTKAPSTKEEDLATQDKTRAANALGKRIGEHWENLTGPAGRFHRALTGKRKIGQDAAADAANVYQGNHNQFKENEDRRVREENERLRRVEEDRLRAERQLETEKLDAEALRLEMGGATLSDRESIFVAAVLRGESGARAAKIAGYKTPEVMGARLLDLPKIVAALAQKREAETLRQQAAAVKAAPVSAPSVPAVQSEASQAGDRTTYSAEVVSDMAVVNAVIDGTHGIPRDLLMVNPVKANQYARELRTVIDRWPGMRLKKTTRTV